MRTVKVKFVPEAMRSILAHPLAPLGGDVKEIREVPDHVSNNDLLCLWDQTADATWIGNGGNGRLSFTYSELAPGKLLRK